MNNSTDLDYLIVGSGLSALVFAALCAKKGASVKVLEAHEHPGGYGHTFSMGKSAKFNAQFHYVWNCGEGETVHQVLAQLGLNEEVTFESLDPDGFDRMCLPGYDVKIPGSSDVLIQRLTALCPTEDHKQIRRFVARVQQVASGLELVTSKITPQRLLKPGFVKQCFAGLVTARHINSTLQDVFDQYNLPLHVQAILASQWPDFLLPPEKLSFFAWVLLFTGYQRGAYYPTKHFEHVIETLVESIRSSGGSVELNQEVTAFIKSGKQITGVRVKDATTGDEYDLTAKRTVSNLDPNKTAEMIGRNQFSNSVQRKLDYEYSPSNFMIYCTVTGLDLQAQGFGRWNTFHAGELDLNRAFRRMYEDHDYSNPSFAITTPGLMTDDCTDRPAGQQIIEFLTVADYDYFDALQKQSRQDYLSKKREIVDSIFDVVERDYISDFRQHVSFKISGTPTTNERFCMTPKGNSYGANMTPHGISRGRVPQDSGLSGLYFCNATAGFPGFAAAFWNGRSMFDTLEG